MSDTTPTDMFTADDAAALDAPEPVAVSDPAVPATELFPVDPAPTEPAIVADTPDPMNVALPSPNNSRDLLIAAAHEARAADPVDDLSSVIACNTDYLILEGEGFFA